MMTSSPRTVHTSRTMMYSELNDLISHRTFNGESIIAANVLRKGTRININKTLDFLSKLYDFERQSEIWKVFSFLWNMTNDQNRRLMTLLYACYKDDLLKLSTPIIDNTPIGKKVMVGTIQEAIEKKFPGRYSAATSISAAQNIASSWKQAGYIEGKVRSIRVAVKPDYVTVLFALYLGKLDGLVGEELLSATWIKTLELSDNKLKALVSEAALNDLITYHHAGGIVAIRFDNLLNQITDDIKS